MRGDFPEGQGIRLPRFVRSLPRLEADISTGAPGWPFQGIRSLVHIHVWKGPAAAVTLGSCRNAWKNESQHSFGKVPRWEIFPNRGFFPWSFAILLPDGHECLARRIPHWGEGHFFYQFTFGGIKDFRLYNLITCISTVYLFEYLYAYIHIQHMSIYIGSLWMFKSFFTVYRRNICFHYYSMAMNLSCICIIKVSNIHWRSLGGQWICKMVQIQMQHYSILFF